MGDLEDLAAALNIEDPTDRDLEVVPADQLVSVGELDDAPEPADTELANPIEGMSFATDLTIGDLA